LPDSDQRGLLGLLSIGALCRPLVTVASVMELETAGRQHSQQEEGWQKGTGHRRRSHVSQKC